MAEVKMRARDTEIYYLLTESQTRAQNPRLLLGVYVELDWHSVSFSCESCDVDNRLNQ